MRDIILKRTNGNDPDFLQLVERLDRDLRNRYPDEQDEYDKHNKIESLANVIVLYVDGVPVGCGCFKPFETETAEIKRMFVDNAYRGNGFSKLVLRTLESWAFETGVKRCVLETAIRQPEAIGLYEQMGYVRIENYGQYKHFPLSQCYEKHLG